MTEKVDFLSCAVFAVVALEVLFLRLKKMQTWKIDKNRQKRLDTSKIL